MLFERGISQIAGVDEAGRGPLAGPVVAAAVVLPTLWIRTGLPEQLHGLNDSKQLTATQRLRFFKALQALQEVRFGIGMLDSEEVDRINILQATHRAMSAALRQLSPAPMHVLVDGTSVDSLGFAQTPIVKGDSKSFSIAAASVLAKVTRDLIMDAYDIQWPAYGFATHKGYGTARHLAALTAHGPCPIHRRTFGPLRQPELFPNPPRKP